jgi:hypothetical protein
MMCERSGEVTAQTRSKSLQLGAIFHAYSKVRTYLLYLSKQLYNPQQYRGAMRHVLGDTLWSLFINAILLFLPSLHTYLFMIATTSLSYHCC